MDRTGGSRPISCSTDGTNFARRGCPAIMKNFQHISLMCEIHMITYRCFPFCFKYLIQTINCSRVQTGEQFPLCIFFTPMMRWHSPFWMACLYPRFIGLVHMDPGRAVFTDSIKWDHTEYSFIWTDVAIMLYLNREALILEKLLTYLIVWKRFQVVYQKKTQLKAPPLKTLVTWNWESFERMINYHYDTLELKIIIHDLIAHLCQLYYYILHPFISEWVSCARKHCDKKPNQESVWLA